MAGKQCSGIINLLFDGFTDNTSRHFTRCWHTQLVKYPRVLSVKPSNKVYLLHNIYAFQVSGFIYLPQKKVQ